MYKHLLYTIFTQNIQMFDKCYWLLLNGSVSKPDWCESHKHEHIYLHFLQQREAGGKQVWRKREKMRCKFRNMKEDSSALCFNCHLLIWYGWMWAEGFPAGQRVSGNHWSSVFLRYGFNKDWLNNANNICYQKSSCSSYKKY